MMQRHRQMVPQWYGIRNTRIQITVWVCKRLMPEKKKTVVWPVPQVPPGVGEGSKNIRRNDRQAIQVFIKHRKLQYCSSPFSSGSFREVHKELYASSRHHTLLANFCTDSNNSMSLLRKGSQMWQQYSRILILVLVACFFIFLNFFYFLFFFL